MLILFIWPKNRLTIKKKKNIGFRKILNIFRYTIKSKYKTFIGNDKICTTKI